MAVIVNFPADGTSLCHLPVSMNFPGPDGAPESTSECQPVRNGGLQPKASSAVTFGEMAGYGGACHRAAPRADPVASNPPYESTKLNPSYALSLRSRQPPGVSKAAL